MSSSRLRWRRFSPIDRDFPIYELLDDDVIVLDVTKDEHGTLTMAFHEGASGRVLDLEVIEQLIAEVKKLLEKDAEAG